MIVGTEEDEVVFRHLPEIDLLNQNGDIEGNIKLLGFSIKLNCSQEKNTNFVFFITRPISPPHGGQTGNRRFRSRSPPPRGSRLRGRSPERYGRSGRSRSTSPERIRRRSYSRSRSRSPTSYLRPGIQISPDPLGYVPSGKAPRCRDYDEKGTEKE